MPLIIGITGSIATGKSSASSALVELGAVHCDADRLVHRLYDPGKPAFYRIVEAFSDEVVGDDGYIDRRILGSKVFGKPEEMNKLTTAIGNIAEAVKGVVDEWNDTLGSDDVALLEAVNLVEAGYGRWCSRVWLFACDNAVALERLMMRNGFSEDEAKQRLSSQKSWEDRDPASDTVFHNNGTLDELMKSVMSEFESIREGYAAGSLSPTKYLEWFVNREAAQ